MLFSPFFPDIPDKTSEDNAGPIKQQSSSLHEHDELGLCSAPDPIKRLEKRSYLPPVSCTGAHEISAVTAKVHCEPRDRVVALPWPNDTSVHQVGQ